MIIANLHGIAQYFENPVSDSPYRIFYLCTISRNLLIRTFLYDEGLVILMVALKYKFLKHTGIANYPGKLSIISISCNKVHYFE